MGVAASKLRDLGQGVDGPTDAREAAKAGGLRYVNPNGPGMLRKRHGKGHRYFDVDGRPLRSKEAMARIKKLVIPPAWTDVWISPIENGHLQAVGRDAKGRRQYRYHLRWREVRDEAKYGHTIAFAKALPAIRSRVKRDLALPGLPREKVLATIVRLLETTLIRVGNDEYARTNGSYGLTTMRNKHVAVNGHRIEFTFEGKSGKKHRIDVQDRYLARIVKRCREIPGYELFQYVDENGDRQSISSTDVNDHLREITGEDFTAKDFRTWAGTVLAAMVLHQCESASSQAQTKRNVIQAIEQVADRLGNTPAICRKCYVHPAVLDAYMEGEFLDDLEYHGHVVAGPRGLDAEEKAVLGFLEARSG
jgi:DNA topoisomerase-1